MNRFKHESDTVEFKETLNDKLEREVVAFLNSKKGGDIYIGVADNGAIVGVETPDKLQLAISDRISSNILPAVLGFYDVFSEEVNGKTIIHIVISRGLEKPYYLKKYGLSPKGCFVRVGTGVKPMSTEMIKTQYSSRTRDSLRNITSPRTAKHTFNQLKIYYAEKGFAINNSFLENLDLYTADHKLNYIAYLFTDINSVSIKVAKYAGKDKVDLIENEEYGYCSIIKATNRVLDKLSVENRTFVKITGAAERQQKSMIDRNALREALINAIVHNDYSREVTPLVEIYSDRLTITSYGGLVEGLSKKEFFSGRSMLRNREIMRIYRDLDLVEQLGSGMNRILSAYSNDIFKFSENFLEVCFHYEEAYLESLAEVTGQVTGQVTVTTEIKKLIMACDGEKSKTELMSIIGLKGRDSFEKLYLQPCKKEAFVEMTIPDKPNSRLQKYRLTEKGLKVKKGFG